MAYPEEVEITFSQIDVTFHRGNSHGGAHHALRSFPPRQRVIISQTVPGLSNTRDQHRNASDHHDFRQEIAFPPSSKAVAHPPMLRALGSGEPGTPTPGPLSREQEVALERLRWVGPVGGAGNPQPSFEEAGRRL